MNIAICDDQDEWIEVIEDYLTRFRRTYRNINWESFYSAEELIYYMQKNKYVFDVLITDIEMKKMNGIDLANQIREKDSGIVIFFLTSHDEYIRQCFQPRPLNFWDKPIKYDQFEKDMKRAISISKENENVFRFQYKGEHLRVQFKNIVYFKTSGKKIIVHTEEQDYEFYGSFNEYDRIWSLAGFVKANRFYYINSKFIIRLKSPDVVLANGEIIQATPVHIKNIKMMFFEYDYADAAEEMEVD